MQNVVGMFQTRPEAEAAIHRLKSLGIHGGSFSVALKDDRRGGAGSGLAESTGTHEIGAFLIAGPLAAALTSAGVGAASGGVLGALVGSGMPEAEATHYLAGVESGHVILAVYADDAQAADVRRVFDEEGSRRTHAV